MPFFDDSGVRPEAEQRGPFWQVFAIIGGQVERFVALNIAWSVHSLPAILAFAAPELPDLLRGALVVYSVAALLPATGALFLLAWRASDGDLINPTVLREAVGQVGVAALLKPGLLYGLFGLLIIGIAWADSAALLLVAVLLRMALLFAFAVGQYWGPIFAEEPTRSPAAILRESLLLWWRYPAPTLLVSGVCFLVAALGVIFVGGLFLIMPVAVALLQISMYRHVTARQARIVR